jgi:hypothetical protein
MRPIFLKVMSVDRLAGLHAEIGLFLSIHMHPPPVQLFEMHVREDIFIGAAAKPEIRDVIRADDRIRLHVRSDGNDKGAILDLEWKFYAEFFSDHPDFYKVKNPVFSFVRLEEASNQFLIAVTTLSSGLVDLDPGLLRKQSCGYKHFFFFLFLAPTLKQHLNSFLPDCEGFFHM